MYEYLKYLKPATHKGHNNRSSLLNKIDIYINLIYLNH